MTRSLAVPVAAPLAMAAIATLARRHPAVQRASGLATIVAVLAYGVALVWRTSNGEVLATQIGGWPPGISIAFVADLFASLMLVVVALMVLVCGFFGVATGEDAWPFFHPVVLVLAAGVAGAVLTADLFNFFVFVEVMLIASHVLLTFRGGAAQVRGGAVYVTTNLLASTILLAGVALLYGVTGTVNLGELAGAAADSGLAAVGAVVILVALGVKASLVPVHGWLPRAYPTATPAVAALFSGLLTKVGVYGMFRVYAVVFEGSPTLRVPLLLVASATMLLGVLGAIGREGMREILSFHIVSQIGYMIMGLGLFGPLGVAGGIFYVLHHIVVKTSLFLVAGAVEVIRGTGALARLGGLAREHRILATAFVFSALSLAGLPPLSGFFAKVVLLVAAFQSSDHGVAAVAIVVSLLTLASMIKIWTGVFWGEGPQPETRPGRKGGAAGVVAPAVTLAAVSVGLGLGAQLLFVLSRRAGEHLVDVTVYVRAVTGG